MAQRGAIIIYDSNGKIWTNTGEAEGFILPNVYPVGLPYIELPYGTLATHKVLSVDVSGEIHVAVLEEIVNEPTYEELKTQVEEMSLM